MKQKIIMLNKKQVIKYFPNYNGFTPSEWNDLNELPKELTMLIKLAYFKNNVYNLNNFALDFNLNDTLTNNKNYIMFIPDSKFNI